MRNRKSNSLNFSLGILFSLSMIFIAFEWSTETYVPKPPEDRQVYNVWAEDYPPVPVLEKKTKPAAAPIPKLINLTDFIVVDNADPEPDEPLETSEVAIEVPDMPVFETQTEDVIDDAPYVIVQNMPTFPGGENALQKYLSSHIVYPQFAIEMDIRGRVYVQFIVEKDGRITSVKVVKGIDVSLDNESLRVVQGMPNWIPGKQNGKAVRVRMNLPVNFILK